MSKTYLGIFLARKPQKGGAYQYTLSIIKALEVLNSDKYKIIVYYQDHAWDKFIPAKFEKCYQLRPLGNKVFSWIYKKLDWTVNSYRRFPILCNPIINEINSSECDLIVFPDQDLESYQVKKKSLVPIHDLMHRYEPHYDEYKGKYIKEREKHYINMCKYATGILVDSELGKKHVIESYNRAEGSIYPLKFTPPYYLLEYKTVDVKRKYNLPDRYLFYPANFWQHKNHENLIKAVHILKKMNKELLLVLVGSKKNYYDNILELIESLKIKDCIRILGYVNDEDMSSLYKNAFALTFTSFLGPTNIPPLEAMVMGCPVICSKKYAMPEQLGEAGLFINPNDPNDIANKILYLIQNTSFRDSMIIKGYAKIKEYDQTCFNSRFEEILTKTLGI